ncbi:27003_t:CDS:10, partial [Gigaspora margarita]
QALEISKNKTKKTDDAQNQIAEDTGAWQDSDDEKANVYKKNWKFAINLTNIMNLTKKNDEYNESDTHNKSSDTLKIQKKLLSNKKLEVTKMKHVNQQTYSQSVIQSVAFHPNAQVTMTTGLDKTIRLFQIDAAVNSNGAEIIAAGRKKILLLEVRSIDKSNGIYGFQDKSLENFSISPCGQYIIFAGNSGYLVLVSNRNNDAEVYQWDINTRRCVNRFRNDALPNSKPLKSIMNLTTNIRDMKFNHDSQILGISSHSKKKLTKIDQEWIGNKVGHCYRCAKTSHSWLTALVNHYNGDKKHIHEFFLSKYFVEQTRDCFNMQDMSQTLITSLPMEKTTRYIPAYSNIAEGVKNVPTINSIETLEILSNKDFFDELGYEMIGSQFFNPPPRTDDYIVKFKHVSEEIDMRFMEIYEKIAGIYPKSYKKPYENWRLFLERNVLIKLTHRMIVLIKLTLFTFNDILQVEQRYCTFLPFDPTIALPASYTTLGCVSDMKDKILKWAYKKAIEELPEEIFTGNK